MLSECKFSKQNGLYFIVEKYMSESKKKKKTVKSTKVLTPLKDLETIKFERLLVDISSRFINLSHEEVNKAIMESLESLSQTLSVDHCSLMEFHEDLSEVELSNA